MACVAIGNNELDNRGKAKTTETLKLINDNIKHLDSTILVYSVSGRNAYGSKNSGNPAPIKLMTAIWSDCHCRRTVCLSVGERFIAFF